MGTSSSTRVASSSPKPDRTRPNELVRTRRCVMDWQEPPCSLGFTGVFAFGPSDGEDSVGLTRHSDTISMRGFLTPVGVPPKGLGGVLALGRVQEQFCPASHRVVIGRVAGCEVRRVQIVATVERAGRSQVGRRSAASSRRSGGNGSQRLPMSPVSSRQPDACEETAASTDRIRIEPKASERRGAHKIEEFNETLAPLMARGFRRFRD
jgi:hypothetical protein